MNSQLNKNIIFTLAYFSAMRYPLTLFELWRNLIQVNTDREKFSFAEIKAALQEEQMRSLVKHRDGVFFLKGDGDLVQERSFAHKLSISKMRRLKRYVKFFNLVPFVRGVFLTGTLSMKNAKTGSDWDILMVLSKGRIWLGRLFVMTFLQIIGKRRHGDKVKERFCLNHYIAENGLILEEYNEFSANFVSTAMPLVGDSIYRRFLQMNEFWIQGIKPNYLKEEVIESGIVELKREGFTVKLQKIQEFILEKTGLAKLLNNFAKKVMIQKIESNPKTKWENADIRYSDTTLVFLPKPHRITIMQKAKERLARLK